MANTSGSALQDHASVHAASLIEGETLDGMIYYHQGDESELTAKKAAKPN